MKIPSTNFLSLGIDIGGTNTVYGVVNDDGEILAKGGIPTTGHSSFHEFIESLNSSVRHEIRNKNISYESIKAIGVGAPCINSDTGVIEGAVNLPWPSPLPLTKELSEVFGIPAAGENDANAAALGEMFYGKAKGMGNFIMITLGTGVGSAIVCDGKLLHGMKGLAGELGHTRIRRVKDARKCNCGRHGCLDAYASARGLILTVKQLIDETNIPSILRNTTHISAKSIGEAANSGDKLAIEALKITGEILGEACADFTAFSSPEAFIFFGGLTNSFQYFIEPLKKSFNDNLLWVYDNQVKFFKSSLSETDAAILGAAAVGKSSLKNRNASAS